MSQYDREEKQKTILRGLAKLKLEIKTGRSHMTATCPKTQHKTTIPRHTVLSSNIVKSICQFLRKNGYSSQEIKKAFKW